MGKRFLKTPLRQFNSKQPKPYAATRQQGGPTMKYLKSPVPNRAALTERVRDATRIITRRLEQTGDFELAASEFERLAEEIRSHDHRLSINA